MPSDDSLRLALLNHMIEEGAAGFFGGHRLGELLLDQNPFLIEQGILTRQSGIQSRGLVFPRIQWISWRIEKMTAAL